MDQYNNYNRQTGQTSGTIAIVLGVISLILAFTPCIGMFALIPGVITLIFSAISLTRASNTNSSKGLAIGGFGLALVSMLIAMLWIAGLRKSGVFDNTDSRQSKLHKLLENIETNIEELEDRDDHDQRTIEIYADEDDFDIDSTESGIDIIVRTDSTTNKRAARLERVLRDLTSDSLVVRATDNALKITTSDSVKITITKKHK